MLRLFTLSLLLGLLFPSTIRAQDVPPLTDLLNPARRYHQLGYSDEALPFLNQAVSAYPREGIVYYWRGQVLEALNRPGPALSDYQVLLALDSLDPHGWFGSARTLYTLARYAEAETAYTQLLNLPRRETNQVYFLQLEGVGVESMFSLEGVNTEVYYQRARARWAQENHEGALADMDRALTLNPNREDIWYERGCMHLALGHQDEAVEDYFACLRQNDRYTSALSELLALEAEVPRVREFFAELSATDNDSPVTHIYSGLYHFQAQDYRAAIAAYSEALRLLPGLPEAHLNRGMAYLRLDELGSAEADYAAAIRADPNYAKAYQQLGTVYFRQGKYERALPQFDNAARLDPEAGITFYNRALTHHYLGHTPQACEDLQQAKALGQSVPEQVQAALCGGE